MSVSRRGKNFHYRFSVSGKRYSGVCRGCGTQKAAEAFEAEIRKETETIRSQKTVAALVENYRQELTGGSSIHLSEAYARAIQKPSRRQPKAATEKQKRAYWNDFATFMAQTHPEVESLSSVRRIHCEEYVRHLIDNGRFVKEVNTVVPGKRGKWKETSYRRDYLLSCKTIREIVGACKWVFNRLYEDAGLTVNPWERVELPVEESTSRDIFTEEELAAIRKGIGADESTARSVYSGSEFDYPAWRAHAVFCRPLFTVAAVTGLTEGDICTLMWGEVDPAARTIRHTRRKTGVRMEIPLLEPFAEHLKTLQREGDYLFPDHARMYLSNRSGVSYRVKAFLEGLGVGTVKRVAGRRAVSTKDMHSMRHVFCFYAGMAGIPATVVQSIVGHMTPEMTRHYMAHASIREKREEMKKLPSILFLKEAKEEQLSPEALSRQKLAALASVLPLSGVRELLETAEAL